MTKCVRVFAGFLVALVFAACCAVQNSEATEDKPSASPKRVTEPGRTETTRPETLKAEPNDIAAEKTKSASAALFDEKFAPILKKYVDENGLVDYTKLKRKRREVRRVLDELAKLNRKEYDSWRQEEKIAFWINVYNMKLLNIIVENYTKEYSRWRVLVPGWGPYSIRHIDKNIGGIRKQKLTVMYEEFTLAIIEERFFRKEFGDPRILLVAAGATLSGPPLRNEPYYGDRLWEQVNEQIKKFLRTPQGIKIERDKQRVYLSELFGRKWYSKDFARKYRTNMKFKDQPAAIQAVLNLVSIYADERTVSFLLKENYTVKFMRYDWNLNDKSRK